MINKSTYVNRKLYRKLISSERKRAENLGFRVKLIYKPISWTRVKDYGLFSSVSGEFCSSTKIIKVMIIGKPGRARILMTLFHEMRHLDHYVLGLYKDYYRITDLSTMELYDISDPFVPEDFVMPNLSVATRAERDCTKVAVERLKKIGINVNLKTEIYPSEHTLAYQIKSRVYELLRRKINELATCKSEGRRRVLTKHIEDISKVIQRSKTTGDDDDQT